MYETPSTLLTISTGLSLNCRLVAGRDERSLSYNVRSIIVDCKLMKYTTRDKVQAMNITE